METKEYLYKQLALDIESQIRRGELAPGEKLPSLRVLKGKLGLSLNTIYQAYVELETMGLVEARAKSGFFIKPELLSKRPTPHFARTTEPPRKVRLAEITNTVVENALNPDLVPLGASILSPDMLPAKLLARIIRDLAAADAGSLLRYAPSEGVSQLRRKLAARMVGMVPNIQEKQVTITNGCTEAVALALLATTRRGDVVAVESPTHFGFLQLLREMGLLVLELPTDPVHGLVTDGLGRILQENRVKVCLTMPNFHNPMGARMPDQRKEALVAMLHERQIPVIEDDVYAEMYFGRKRPRLLKHWDRDGLVISCSSFSKVLAPGFRVGWVVADAAFTDRIRRLKAGLSMAAPTMQQFALARLLTEGGLDRHLRLLRAAVNKHLLQIAAAIQKAFLDECRLALPRGGNMLWVELPPWADGIRLYQQALKRGISIIPGAAFSATDRFHNYIRISCTAPFTGKIEKAIQVLGLLLKNPEA